MVVCEIKPHIKYPNRTPITIAGSQIFFSKDVGTPTSSLNLVKLIIKIVLSRRNARFVYFDIKKLPPNPNGAIRVCPHKTFRHTTRICRGI